MTRKNRLLAIALLSAAGAVAAAPSCVISESDLHANQALTFSDFDQVGSLPSTARKLSERGCYVEAATAGEHYLLFGPSPTLRERSIIVWHLTQNLAMAGKEPEAAHLAAAAIRAHDPSDDADDFQWNAYVRGTWAFLTKRRPLLLASIQRLRSAGGERNHMNAGVLDRLDLCFTRSYADAYASPACRIKP
ncbi:hypothetical protein [Roseateles sp.]|uniref:hypothetical protein n=1 Tax=Roseateles sp. TaxID=1971397 RepID=UPI003BAC56DC